MTPLRTVTHIDDPFDVHLLRLLALMRAALCACLSNTAVVNVGDGAKHDGVKPPTHLQERGRVGREGRGEGGRGGNGRGGE